MALGTFGKLLIVFSTKVNLQGKSDLPDDVVCDIAIYADDTTPYSKCDQVSDLWQQLELTSEFESDLRDTVDWGQEVTCWFQCWENSTGFVWQV